MKENLVQNKSFEF